MKKKLFCDYEDNEFSLKGFFYHPKYYEKNKDKVVQLNSFFNFCIKL